MTKQQIIIQTALNLFSHYGYHSIGVDRIRDEAQVSKMTMYKYFPSKEVLIENVLITRDKDFTAQWQQTVAQHSHYLNQLQALFSWHQNWFNQPTFHGCLFIKANEEFPEHPIIQQLCKDHKNNLTNIIQAILVKAKFAEANQLAQYLTIVLEGLIINHNMFNTSQRVVMTWDYTKQLLTTHDSKSS